MGLAPEAIKLAAPGAARERQKEDRANLRFQVRCVGACGGRGWRVHELSAQDSVGLLARMLCDRGGACRPDLDARLKTRRSIAKPSSREAGAFHRLIAIATGLVSLLMRTLRLL